MRGHRAPRAQVWLLRGGALGSGPGPECPGPAKIVRPFPGVRSAGDYANPTEGATRGRGARVGPQRARAGPQRARAKPQRARAKAKPRGARTERTGAPPAGRRRRPRGGRSEPRDAREGRDIGSEASGSRRTPSAQVSRNGPPTASGDRASAPSGRPPLPRRARARRAGARRAGVLPAGGGGAPRRGPSSWRGLGASCPRVRA